ncbi:MAG: carbon-nitrogen hydrolase family protein [Gammaproteobacteria bacterium]
MTSPFTAACVQNCADTDVRVNIEEASHWVEQASGQGADLIALPEYFSFIAPDDATLLANAYSESDHPALSHFMRLAKSLGAWVLLGSLAIKVSETKVNNRSYLLDAKGQIVARYNKIHLFDVSLRSGETYRESNTVVPGDTAVLARTPWGMLGMSVCYDLRFAYLYRRLAQAGASFLAIPAAFTKTTGEAHWHVLQRARAIETGCYVFAPGQHGVRKSGRATYGHSLIIDPWGEVLASGGEQAGYILAEIDPAKVIEARRMIPALEHDRVVSGPGGPESL